MLKKWFNELSWTLCERFAPAIIDVRTGKELGHGLVLAFGSKVWVIGYRGSQPLVPVFLPEKKLRYWKLRIGFTTTEEPDYPNIRESL